MTSNSVWHSYFLFFSLFLFSCGNTLPEIKDVDLKRWKDDRNGCNGHRTFMVEAFRTQKNKLLGLSEMEIVSLLGKPDENELYERNQKFYHYFFDPSASCAQPSTAPRELSIRFNATGRAKEVMVE